MIEQQPAALLPRSSETNRTTASSIRVEEIVKSFEKTNLYDSNISDETALPFFADKVVYFDPLQMEALSSFIDDLKKVFWRFDTDSMQMGGGHSAGSKL